MSEYDRIIYKHFRDLVQEAEAKELDQGDLETERKIVEKLETLPVNEEAAIIKMIPIQILHRLSKADKENRKETTESKAVNTNEKIQ